MSAIEFFARDFPSPRATRFTVLGVFSDWLRQLARRRRWAPNLALGRRGEDLAHRFLRRSGYIIVARNYRTPRRNGEVDLIGWDGDTLCFIEVKTRTTFDVKSAEAAVDREKQQELRGMAREYLRRSPAIPTWRFDVLSVYHVKVRPEGSATVPRFELFRNAFAAR